MIADYLQVETHLRADGPQLVMTVWIFANVFQISRALVFDFDCLHGLLS